MNKYSFNNYVNRRSIMENAELLLNKGFPVELFLDWYDEVGKNLSERELQTAIIEGWKGRLAGQVAGALGGGAAGTTIGGLAGPGAAGVGGYAGAALGAHKGGQWGDKAGDAVSNWMKKKWQSAKTGAANALTGIGDWAKKNSTNGSPAPPAGGGSGGPPPAPPAGGGSGGGPPPASHSPELDALRTRLGSKMTDPKVISAMQFLQAQL